VQPLYCPLMLYEVSPIYLDEHINYQGAESRISDILSQATMVC
jgi:hypothetical protein